MKVQFCSDLHLEFPENRKFLTRNPINPAGEILVLAGDIVCFRELERASSFIDYVSDHYSEVYWVPGNHEYYGSDIREMTNPLWENIRSNVHLVNNQAIDRGGLRLVLSTLWSCISPLREWDIQRSMSDFSAITYDNGRFTPSHFNMLHEESLVFLKTSLASTGDIPTVVVTHHVPTLMNYPPVFKSSTLTEAFAVELFELIETSGAVSWIYGHHHVNTPSFKIGRTMMLTNQLGYVHHHEHGSFRQSAVVEVNARGHETNHDQLNDPSVEKAKKAVAFLKKHGSPKWN
jgi:predicted phosphohydrolase